MKILLCYAYADLNKGDSAICLGAKEFLKETYPNASVDLLNFASEDKHYAKLTKSYYENLGDIVIDRENVGNNSKIGVLANKFFSFDKKKIKEVIKNNDYDLVVMNGGHFIYSSKENNLIEKLKNSIRLDYVFAPFYAAKELGIKTGILGQSIGPINGDEKCLDIISKSDFIFTREKKSSEEVNSYYDNESIAKPHIDLAFFMDVVAKNEIKNDSKYIAINLRKVVASGGMELTSGEYDQQFNETEVLVRFILENSENNICLFSQVKGFVENSGENDEDIHQEFKNRYFKDEPRVKVKHLDSSEESIINFYRDSCSLLISTRFHGLIFSMLAGIPSIAFNVNGIGNKIVGLYKDLGLESFVFSDGDSESLIEIYKKINKYPEMSFINDGISRKKDGFLKDFLMVTSD